MKGFELGSPDKFSPIPQQHVRNSPTSINGRNYTGHAVDQMENRGIPHSAVENTILFGTKSSSRQNSNSIFYEDTNNIKVILNERGDVVTVMYGKP